MHVIQHLLGPLCPDLIISTVPEKTYGDYDVAFQSQAFLNLQEFIFETSAAAKRDDLILSLHDCYDNPILRYNATMTLNFGFSYVGLIYLIMLMTPNIIWTKNLPKDYETFAANENKILLTLERTGEVLSSGIVLIFSDFNLKPWSNWSWFLVISFALMILYEIYWIRYFRSEKTMKDLYSSILCFPVAGATLPVLAFLLLAIYGKNIFLAIAVTILGIGHIGIHLMHRMEAQNQ